MTRHYLPLSILVAILIAILLGLRHRRSLQRLAGIGGQWAGAVVPRLLALSTFLAGTVLLFSGTTPPVGDRLRWLIHVLPLPVVEFAHFFGSITGIALLLLARGLQRRLDAAYHLSVALLFGGILFSFLKAFDYEEAIFLSVLLLLLLPNRRYFHRRTSLVDERFTAGWIAAIALVVLGSIALGVLTYQPTFERGLQVWKFSRYNSEPRALRATIGVLVVIVGFAIARLLRPARPRLTPPGDDDTELARAIAARSPEAMAQLVTLGDKAFLFDATRSAFIMYGVSGRSWVSMGDPVGPPEYFPDLVSAFIDRSSEAGGWPVFYKVGREHLGTYLDFGLAVVKLGEEARVPLSGFSLEGPDRRNLRRVWRKAVDEGCAFEVACGDAVVPLIPELRRVSDEWLASKATREKGFSLGFFDEAYLRRFPVGIVRRAGRVVAFANVWPSGQGEELEVDLMRFCDDAPPGIMRYLLAEFMLWGRDREYRWFNLGMSPLSGLRKSAFGPFWFQIARTLYGYGERFYNFQGIRSFKDWFYPVWQPRYLVSPGGAARPIAVANIAALIAGGYEGVLRK